MRQAEYDLPLPPATDLSHAQRFVLDLISIVLIVVPLAIPLVKTFGIDPLWFAVVMLVVLQTSYLTPPMAPSIFYLKAIAPPDIRLKHMYWGVIPFIVCQLLTLIAVISFPALATWLPAPVNEKSRTKVPARACGASSEKFSQA